MFHQIFSIVDGFRTGGLAVSIDHVIEDANELTDNRLAIVERVCGGGELINVFSDPKDHFIVGFNSVSSVCEMFKVIKLDKRTK